MEELEVNVVDVHNDEILDAAIAYKTDGTYPTEASKDKNGLFEIDRSGWKLIKENYFSYERMEE